MQFLAFSVCNWVERRRLVGWAEWSAVSCLPKLICFSVFLGWFPIKYYQLSHFMICFIENSARHASVGNWLYISYLTEELHFKNNMNLCPVVGKVSHNHFCSMQLLISLYLSLLISNGGLYHCNIFDNLFLFPRFVGRGEILHVQYVGILRAIPFLKGGQRYSGNGIIRENKGIVLPHLYILPYRTYRTQILPKHAGIYHNPYSFILYFITLTCSEFIHH